MTTETTTQPDAELAGLEDLGTTLGHLRGREMAKQIVFARAFVKAEHDAMAAAGLCVCPADAPASDEIDEATRMRLAWMLHAYIDAKVKRLDLANTGTDPDWANVHGMRLAADWLARIPTAGEEEALAKWEKEILDEAARDERGEDDEPEGGTKPTTVVELPEYIDL